MDSKQQREAMVASQLRTTRVSDPALVKALRAVPRELFVPAAKKPLAYIDEDIAIAPGRYLMEPMVFARLLDKALVNAGEKVLVIAGGLGYGAAVLAHMGAQVIVLEADKSLAKGARTALGLSGAGSVAVVEGDHLAGHPAGAPYDLIVIEAMVERLPEAIVDQLADGGRLVGVMLQDGVGRGIIGRRAGESFGVSAFMDAHVAALPEFARTPAFEF